MSERTSTAQVVRPARVRYRQAQLQNLEIRQPLLDRAQIQELLASNRDGDEEKRRLQIIQRANSYYWHSCHVRPCPYPYSDTRRKQNQLVTKRRILPLEPKHRRPHEGMRPYEEYLGRMSTLWPAEMYAWWNPQSDWALMAAARLSEALESDEFNRLTANLGPALDAVPHLASVSKVVCIGLGKLMADGQTDGDGDGDAPPRPQECPGSLARHLLARRVAHEVQRRRDGRRGPPVRLYAADARYGLPDVAALERPASGREGAFEVLDASYGSHEQFVLVDDATVVVAVFEARPDPWLELLLEYARPVAIIGEVAHDDDDDAAAAAALVLGDADASPAPEGFWYEVQDPDAPGDTYAVPGRLPNSGTSQRVWDVMTKEYDWVDGFPGGSERERSDPLFGLYARKAAHPEATAGEAATPCRPGRPVQVPSRL